MALLVKNQIGGFINALIFQMVEEMFLISLGGVLHTALPSINAHTFLGGFPSRNLLLNPPHIIENVNQGKSERRTPGPRGIKATQASPSLFCSTLENNGVGKFQAPKAVEGL